MSEETVADDRTAFTYKGRTVKIRQSPPGAVRAHEESGAVRPLIADIDGEKVEIERHGAGGFETILLPYGTYESPRKLVEDVIDYVPEFKRPPGATD